MTVSGLESGQSFAVRATTLDQRSREWIAEARFAAGTDGRGRLSELEPLPGGSYEGADAMGLFWSAEPAVEGAQIGHGPGLEYVTRLALIVDGETVDEDTVARRFDRRDLIREDVVTDEVVGTYFRPTGEGPYAGVVVFAGSDGGLASANWRAALLASRGFAALAVAVFRYEGRPADLVEIPLEDGSAAVSWLADRPQTGRVGVLGFSKGSELALSLAARDPSIDAVVAISPSAFVWPGISDGPPETRSSWSWRGNALTPIPWSVGERAGAMFAAGPPFELRLLYEESIEAAAPDVRSAAEIPVTDIVASVLLVSGEQDGSWPASDMADLLVERMMAAGRGGDIEHLRYPGSGHLIFWDYLPATSAGGNRGQIFGGTAAATAAARADSWPRIQDFLMEALRPHGAR